MKTSKFTSLILLITILCNTEILYAQFRILEKATEDIILTASSAGTNNRSGIAYNPDAKLYYSVNAGSSAYPVDIHGPDGTLLANPQQGFDYRGAWWNPNFGTFEGNGFSDLGIFIHTLSAGTSYPSGTGAVVLTANQPNSQSVGDLDYINNEIVYLHNGFIYTYSRTSNSFLGQFIIGDLPAGSVLNSNSIIFTGIKGLEYGVYDYSNKRLLFVDRSSRAVVGSSQLPETAPQRSSFGMSYANGLFWLFSGGSWKSYKVTEPVATSMKFNQASRVRVYPNPVSDLLRLNLDQVTSPVHLKLLNMSGQVMYERTTENVGEMDIEMSNYKPGIYVLKVLANENIETIKIQVVR